MTKIIYKFLSLISVVSLKKTLYQRVPKVLRLIQNFL